MSKESQPEVKKGLMVLNPRDVMQFNCAPGLDCFTQCCRNITIFLTPYDILRMKNALHLGSEEFLERYTRSIIGKNGLPVVLLRMLDDDAKSCPFVSSAGCSIYADRPWSCRIYPLQPESSKITDKAGKVFYSVMDVPFCRGLQEERTVRVEQWIEEQGIAVYLEMEALFKRITADDRLANEKITNKKIQEMFYMASYDLDRFRLFVLESTFLERFEIEPEAVAKIKTDDTALYRLAMQWLEYGLLAQHTLKLKTGVLSAKQQELGIQ